MKRIFARAVVVLVFLAALICGGDLASFVLRRALHRNVYDTVPVDVVNVIPQKGNKAEYDPQGVQNVNCARALLPHEGLQPCWYLRRHTTQEVNF